MKSIYYWTMIFSVIVLITFNVIQLIISRNQSKKISESDTKLHALQATLQNIDFMAGKISSKSWETLNIKDIQSIDELDIESIKEAIESIKQKVWANIELTNSILITVGTALWYHFDLETYLYDAYKVGAEFSKYTEKEKLPKAFLHKNRLDDLLKKARKAESTGKKTDALNDYKEVLFFFSTDDIDDSSQKVMIESVKSKIAELSK